MDLIKKYKQILKTTENPIYPNGPTINYSIKI